MRLLTSQKAAEKVGISLITLQRWIADGKLHAPKLTIRSGRAVRLWAARDIAALREVKQTTYGKGRGRKPKRKRK
jgi:excisionase family DNA binding protein